MQSASSSPLTNGRVAIMQGVGGSIGNAFFDLDGEWTTDNVLRCEERNGKTFASYRVSLCAGRVKGA